jgi:parallel beta-helix repeat protein
MRHFALFLPFLFPLSLHAQSPEIPLSPNLTITQSTRIKPDTYHLPGAKTDLFTGEIKLENLHAVLLIKGDNIEVDFQNAILQGNTDKQLPDAFYGLAIRVQGSHITLKNARVHGFKLALLAEDATDLRLENCDFSYNYRPKLRSVREREDFSDWLSYHHNEKDEWLRYGAGMYLKNCTRPMVKACRVTGNQNALLMTGCTDALVYNNTFQFNSGLGIGLYRSSRNRLMHNRLDWNVRGYSHGFYARGQDSAGLLLYEQSSNNLIAFNSATHCGDGFFLWAGQETMDTGKGGCNDNVIFGNDFSHAPTNGVEVTFSRNRIQGNYIADCTYGIWGGYSYQSVITGNLISDCLTAIAIEQGQNDTIRQNLFKDDSLGIRLWARATQPADWAYAQQRDVRSRDGLIDRNVFLGVRKPLKISASQNISVNGENLFFNFDKLFDAPEPNTDLKFWRNDIFGPAAAIEAVWQHPELNKQRKLNFDHPGKNPDDPYAPLMIPYVQLKEPDSLPDGMLAVLPADFPQGRKNIIMDEWGPYDFKRPMAVLREIKPGAGGKTLYNFDILGPFGSWSLTEMRGLRNPSAPKGITPASITLERDPEASDLALVFVMNAPEAITTAFGKKLGANQSYLFDFKRFELPIHWDLQFYNYNDTNDPRTHAEALETFKKQKPDATLKSDDLYFAWWDKPATGIQEDHFATRATATVELTPGLYTIALTSDDGARLYIDGKHVIDHWDVHEPATDEISVKLGGKHHFEIEHFDADGFATLGFRIKPAGKL